jgi:hypothetical protein
LSTVPHRWPTRAYQFPNNSTVGFNIEAEEEEDENQDDEKSQGDKDSQRMKILRAATTNTTSGKTSAVTSTASIEAIRSCNIIQS